MERIDAALRSALAAAKEAAATEVGGCGGAEQLRLVVEALFALFARETPDFLASDTFDAHRRLVWSAIAKHAAVRPTMSTASAPPARERFTLKRNN